MSSATSRGRIANTPSGCSMDRRRAPRGSLTAAPGPIVPPLSTPAGSRRPPSWERARSWCSRHSRSCARRCPFAFRGIDSDNGSEFINQHLWDYCQRQEIQFTRGRPYKKDDNAHIEQKNWTHVRKLLGYVRYDTPAAQAAIHALYRRELRLFQDPFLPSVQLLRQDPGGARGPP